MQLVVANRLGFAYDDIVLKFNGKPVPGPFSISDMPIKHNDELDVIVKEEATPASQMKADLGEEAKVGESSEDEV